MADILIRGLSEAAVARIDADALACGLSRHEYLHQRFEREGCREAIAVHGDTRGSAPNGRRRRLTLTIPT